MGGPTPEAVVGSSADRSQQCPVIGYASWCQTGLVDGLQGIATERFYSRSMDLRGAAEMVSRKDFILKAGLRDAGGDGLKLKEDLGHILGNARAFFAQKVVLNHEELQRALGDIVQQQREFVCLLGGKSTGKSMLLRDLVSSSKSQANVILVVSSDHSFPFGLKRVMFNLANFARFVYAGEVPPKDMLRLLEEKWGVGPHLALALLAHYGGHVWETYQALNPLCGHPAFFVGVDPFKSSSVRQCLAWQPSVQQQELATAERGRMRDTLRLLAERGFAPIPMEDDPGAGVLSRHDVAGIVKAGSLVVGLPPEAWGDTKFGVVPTTQSMRLAIAEVLVSVQDSRTAEVPVLTP